MFFHCQTFQIESPPPPFVFANSYARVKLKSNLVLKDSPNLNSVTLGSITVPDNYIILTKSRTEYRDVVNGFEDYWYEVEYRDKTGWVFGKLLDFSDEETSIVRFLTIMETNPNLTNLKKVKKYYDENFKILNIEQAILLYGKPNKELKYTLSNHHGGFNRYIDFEYNDFKLKFMDKQIIEISIYTNELLNPLSRNLPIGTEWKFIEYEFGLPFYISKNSFIYSTCNPSFANTCSGNYADNVEFKIENHKVKSISFMKYID